MGTSSIAEDVGYNKCTNLMELFSIIYSNSLYETSIYITLLAG